MNKFTVGNKTNVTGADRSQLKFEEMEAKLQLANTGDRTCITLENGLWVSGGMEPTEGTRKPTERSFMT